MAASAAWPGAGSRDFCSGSLNDLLNGGDVNDVKQAQSTLKSAQAALDLAKMNLAKATLVAPLMCRRTDSSAPRRAGQHQRLDDQHGCTCTARHFQFLCRCCRDQSDISKMAVNQPATLTFDSLPGATVKESNTHCRYRCADW